ncbi:MAG: dihydrodipicolinate synthase family protein [Gemmatimonadaceae bacterium]|nr:dihydrodipicolinate synthase family protein [Gemmatimonadaceae bacterium]
MIRLEGILAPVVTPFDDAGEVDAAGFVRNVRAHLAAGLSGIVVTGSTGEAALLDDDERMRLVELARREVPAGTPLIAGTGSESTRATLARSRLAAERGADAVLVVAPHYYGDAMTVEALREHYRRVADESPVPVLLYSIPKYMHFAIAPELVAELALHENVVGIKDSSGDPAQFTRYLASQSESFRVLTGNGPFYREALRLGASGAILAVSLFAPAHARAVLDAHQRGHDQEASDAQGALSPLASIVGAMGVAGIKAALDRVGLVGGTPRPPLQPIAGAALARVEQLLRDGALAAA